MPSRRGNILSEKVQREIVSYTKGFRASLSKDKAIVCPDVVTPNNTFSLMKKTQVFLSEMLCEGHIGLSRVLKFFLSTVDNIPDSPVVESNNDNVSIRFASP